MMLKFSWINPKYTASYEEAMNLHADMQKYNLAKKIIKHGKILGKRVIHNALLDVKELRYARFKITPKPIPLEHPRNLVNIPIPFMKQDHGIVIY